MLGQPDLEEIQFGKGQSLMFAATVETAPQFDLPEYKGIPVTSLIHDYYAADPKRGFFGGAGIDARFDFFPASFALHGLPPDTPRWGGDFKKTFEIYFTRTMSLLSHTSSLAQARNNVSLDPDVKDGWGLPAPRITFNYHPDDVATFKWALEKQVEILEVAGAKKVWSLPYDVTDNMPSRHLMGTCRMGMDPEASVVNAFSRAGCKSKEMWTALTETTQANWVPGNVGLRASRQNQAAGPAIFVGVSVGHAA